MDKILHDPKDPKLWELWYIPYYGSCRILSINRIKDSIKLRNTTEWRLGSMFKANSGFPSGSGRQVQGSVVRGSWNGCWDAVVLYP